MKTISGIERFDSLVSERNVATTFVLYGVLILAGLFIAVTTDDLIWRLVRFVGDEREMQCYGFLAEGETATFWQWIVYNYGKGWIPGWLIGIAAGICNYRVIKGHRDGVLWMAISFFFIIFPTLFNEIEEVIWFSISVLATIAVYWALLFLPRKGKTYWSLCAKAPRWLAIAFIVIVLVWIDLVCNGFHMLDKMQRQIYP